MSDWFKLGSVRENQLNALATALVLSPGPSTREVRSAVRVTLRTRSYDEQLELLMNYTDNRWLFVTGHSPSEVQAHLEQWLVDQGITNGQLQLVSDDVFTWAKRHKLDQEEQEGWDDEGESYTWYATPSWLYGATYRHLKASWNGVDLEAEVVSRPYQVGEAILLVYLRGQPPFSAIATALHEFLQIKGYRLIDNRPPCVGNLSKSDDAPIYFRPDPRNPRQGIPYFELRELLANTFQFADPAVQDENTPLRALLIYQLHSLADHASSLFLSRFALYCTVLPAGMKNDIAGLNSLGPRLNWLHDKLGVILGWENDAIDEANRVRNRLYHAELSVATRYIDYRNWYEISDPLFLIPMPRRGDMAQFQRGVRKLFVALGYGEAFPSWQSPPLEMPSRVRQGHGIFAGRSYLACSPINGVLSEASQRYAYSWHTQPTICERCGMRLFGIQAKRCIFCCPKCGNQDATLAVHYPCGHADHPLFELYGYTIKQCLNQADTLATDGRLAEATQVTRLLFDLAISAAWLQGKNYFDVVDRLRDFGICLVPDWEELRRQYPELMHRPEHWRGLQAMRAIESAGSCAQYFASSPTEEEYRLARDLLHHSLSVLKTSDLPLF